MWKRNVNNLIKTALKTSPQNQAPLTSTSLLLRRQQQRQPTRHFSTQQQQELPNKDPTAASVDSFLRTPSTGLVYGRLSGITNHTTKIDVVMLLDGCDLTPDDVKVDYNRSYVPLGMLIQFPSRNAYDAAIRTIIRKGRVYKLDRANRSEWEVKEPYDGKAILLQGIPRNALVDDVERFLSGCQYDATSLQLVTRQAFPDPIRMAVVRFPSKAQAMHAYLTKNRGFCLNNQILARVLH